MRDSVETGQPARAWFCATLAGSVRWASESESQAANGDASSKLPLNSTLSESCRCHSRERQLKARPGTLISLRVRAVTFRWEITGVHSNVKVWLLHFANARRTSPTQIAAADRL